MKKRIITLVASAMLIMGVAGCSPKNSEGNGTDTNTTTETAQKFMVFFKVDGETHKTIRVENGSKITDEIPEPSKSGYDFEGWYEDGYAEGKTKLDFDTYVVTKSVSFEAHFVESEDTNLNVNDVRDPSKTKADYHLVLGWWEVKDEKNPDKVTSGLTEDLVKRTYSNIIKFLKATGATNEQIDAISFRNYASDTVAHMGDLIVADDNQAEVLIGVGNNFFNKQDASSPGTGLTPYTGDSSTSKFAAVMGASGESRYVTILDGARSPAVSVFEWLKENPKVFTKKMSDEEVAKTLQVNLAVTIHGDTDVTTTLTDKTTTLQWPVITVDDGKEFKGLATTAGGEVALRVEKDADITYLDVKDLADGAETLDLYPVIEDIPVVDPLKVYVQTSSNIPTAEAELLEARFRSTLADDELVEFVFNGGNASTFKSAVDDDETADVVIGGNSPLKEWFPDVASDATELAKVVKSAGAKHFKNTSRKVAVLPTCDNANKALAEKLSAFVTADAISYDVHAALWARHDNGWMTADEVTSVTAAIKGEVATHLAVADEAELLSTYNVTVTVENVVTADNSTKVAAFVTATNALRGGKGTDLIVACGTNIADNTTVVAWKKVDTTVLSKGRCVALVNDNGLTRDVYTTVFPELVA